MFWKIISLIASVLSYVPVYVYNLLYSRYYTKWTYFMLADRMERKMDRTRSVMDVGIGTGHPMKQIIHRIPSSVRVLGIDIDRNYLKYATQTFKKHDNVEIREQNFYELESSKEQFDVIIFSSSFMIMPDRIKALQIAKMRLNKGGSIYFLLTLEQYRNYKTMIIEKVKPYMKYLTTVDFGQITYEKDFDLMLRDNGLNVISKELVAKQSIFLAVFRMFVVETEVV